MESRVGDSRSGRTPSADCVALQLACCSSRFTKHRRHKHAGIGLPCPGLPLWLVRFRGDCVSITRRDFLVGSAALAAGTTVAAPFLLPKYHSDRRTKRSRVAILQAQQYSGQLDQILAAGLRLLPINVRDKTVLLKPNLVDYIPGNAINTHPMLVLAAAESFRRL